MPPQSMKTPPLVETVVQERNIARNLDLLHRGKGREANKAFPFRDASSHHRSHLCPSPIAAGGNRTTNKVPKGGVAERDTGKGKWLSGVSGTDRDVKRSNRCGSMTQRPATVWHTCERGLSGLGQVLVRLSSTPGPSMDIVVILNSCSFVDGQQRPRVHQDTDSMGAGLSPNKKTTVD